jgi:hypothetical protein
VDGIDFNINKKVVDGKIVKSILFEHKSKDYAFKEEVKAFSLDDFHRMFASSGFKVVNCFGNYALDQFDELNSDRLIFICKKADA